MSRTFVLMFVLAVTLLSAGCQTTTNSNTNSAPNANSTPLPPGFSTTPLPQGGTPPPGIPAPGTQQNTRPQGTPPAGIPDPQARNNNANQMDEKTTPSKGPISSEQTNQKRRP
jgi:hypothetical protein